MFSKFKSLVLNVTLCFIFSFCQNPILLCISDSETKIVILHTNDVHGRFKTSEETIGLDTIKSAKKFFSSKSPTILVDAGDAIQGTPFCLLNGDQDDNARMKKLADLMNSAGYDIQVLGNHEFDHGTSNVLEYVKNLNSQVLGANIKKISDSNLFLSDENKKGNGENYIMEIGGKKIGFFGITTEETTRTTPPQNLTDIKFDDEIATSSEQVQKLKKKGADLIVGVTHLGVGNSTKHTSREIAQKVQGIDVIIDGHSHSKLSETVNGVLIAQTGAYSSNLGKIEIDFKKDGSKKIDSSLMDAKQLGEMVSPDKEVSEKYEKHYSEISPITDKVIGKSLSSFFGGTCRNQNITRISETNMGDILGDAMWEYGKDKLKNTKYQDIPVVALDNGGAVRAGISGGYITYGNLLGVLPTGNNITFQIVTPKQLYSVFERGLGKIKFNEDYFDGAFGGFPQVAGVKIDFDISKKGYDYNTDSGGERVVSVSLADSNGDTHNLLSRDDDETKIVLLFNDWAIYEFPSISDTPVFQTGDKLVDILAEHIRNLTLENEKEFSYPVTQNRVNLIFKKEFPVFDSKITVRNSSEVLANSNVKVSVDDKNAVSYKTDKNGDIIIKNLTPGIHRLKIAYDNHMEDEILVSNFLDLKNGTCNLSNKYYTDVSSVENIIGQIPAKISFDDASFIKFARNSYNSLDDFVKNQVVNYSKLEESEKKLSKLKGNYFSDMKGNIVIIVSVILASSLAVLAVMVVKNRKYQKINK